MYQKAEAYLLDSWGSHPPGPFKLRPFDPESLDASHIILDKAFLWQADLAQIYMPWASLRETDLTEANLAEAKLWHGNLYKAKLRKAILGGADLSGADLSEAKLIGGGSSYGGLSSLRQNCGRLN
jgi:uncharacterized protein YjbI with pentapeptide repeats